MSRTVNFYIEKGAKFSAVTGKPIKENAKGVTYTHVAKPEEFKKKKYAPKVTLGQEDMKNFSDLATMRMWNSLYNNHPSKYEELEAMMSSKGAKYLSYSYKKHAFILYKSRPVKLGVFPLPADIRKTRPAKAN